MTAKDFQAIAVAVYDARVALYPDTLTHLQAQRSATTLAAQREATDAFIKAQAQVSLVDRVFNGMARDVAKVLAEQSPKFNRARFLDECGVGR